MLGREVSKPQSVGVDGAELRQLAELVLTQHLELSELRSAISSASSDFDYYQPEPERSTVVNVVFMPGIVAAPPSYDFD